jgi:quaternary ammonium compound-resistance protein SugE
VVTLSLSIFLLGWSIRTLPMGTAYPVWTGIGAIGTVILGIWLFNEPASFWRIACIVMILAGIVGLKATTP